MRRVGVALAGVLVLGHLGGCGNGTNAVQAVTGAATKTAGARTAKFSAVVTSEGGMFAKGLNEEGAFDFTNRRGRIQVDPSTFGIPGLTAKVDAVIDFSAGLVEYVHFPELASELGGKEWMKVDVAQLLKQQTGADVSAALQGQSSDPNAGLQQLRGATAVTEIGKEKIRGVDATHYRATIDVDKAAREAPASARDAMQKLANLYRVKTFPVDVWLDGSGRVVRQVLTTDTSTMNIPTTVATTGSAIGKISVTMEFFDFGAAVDATPPPADQTANFSDLLAGSGQPFKSVGSSLS
jgi:hypothetical protein